MSKASSHQFSGTKGEKIAQGKVPANQKGKLIEWANDVVSYIESTGGDREHFNTACVAFDEATGNLYFGRNGGVDRDGKNLHPLIKSILPSQNLEKWPSTWNCAETDAINQAVHAGVPLGNLHIYTISVRSRNFGKEKASCKNCTYMYRGRIKTNNTGWSE